MTSLSVRNLHPDVTEGLLYEKFSPAGEIRLLMICRDSRTAQSLGYAYVNFSQQIEAERVLDTMNFDLLKGKPIRIVRCQTNHSLRKCEAGNVFVGNLDKGIDNNAMYDTFSAFGNISSCKVALDEYGISKGYGFVQFQNLDSANNKAAEKVNDGMLFNGKMVYLSKFTVWPKRRKETESSYKITINPRLLHLFRIKPQQLPRRHNNTYNNPPVSGNDGDSDSTSINISDCKDIVGQKIYERICKFYPNIAGKLTGKLLEMDIRELEVLANSGVF